MTPQKRTGTQQHSPQQGLERLNIRISGSGGQGVISTGMLLGEALAIGDGKNVSQSQSYGPEARGGATRADIIVSDGEIYFPECNRLDILVAFTYEAYEKYAIEVKAEGLVLADEQAVDVLVGNATTLQMPFLELAVKKFKRSITANMIALGFLATFTKIVSKHALRDVVQEQFAGTKYEELNIKALEQGFRLGVKHGRKKK